MTSSKKQKAIENRKARRQVGGFGKTRGKEAQARRAKVRKENPRYQSAMAERAEAERRLSRLKGGHIPIGQYAGVTRRIMEGLQAPKVTVNVSEEVKQPERVAPIPSMDIPTIDAKAEGTDWSLGQARSMLRSGYRIDHVIQVTGWGPDWFDDLPLDDDGYGLDPFE